MEGDELLPAVWRLVAGLPRRQGWRQQGVRRLDCSREPRPRLPHATAHGLEDRGVHRRSQLEGQIQLRILEAAGSRLAHQLRRRGGAAGGLREPAGVSPLRGGSFDRLGHQRLENVEEDEAHPLPAQASVGGVAGLRRSAEQRWGLRRRRLQPPVVAGGVFRGGIALLSCAVGRHLACMPGGADAAEVDRQLRLRRRGVRCGAGAHREPVQPSGPRVPRRLGPQRVEHRAGAWDLYGGGEARPRPVLGHVLARHPEDDLGGHAVVLEQLLCSQVGALEGGSL
mmetsp:Transcript_67656/g.195551  ORF Transcript_67656/g.195551 Transcript_67656/m.195551 type:complete len:282 (-) Transcript_67656:396-1241(-)